ncbi:cysteine dioxygenase family protein [Cupriavidus pampae]|uniref:3-mercaptopropionate dioxygenase n=1 Tax=Cupriavidus pampae TaxID=659251 RepID=A0ABN7Z1W2_9BURK|nr:cysteine dioxygenase [Cupriavidus pampae]CAG9179900.1 3-mercaptopropionate dioxygenase [Cupriavidus pampae]
MTLASALDNQALARFIGKMDQIVADARQPEEETLARTGAALRELVSRDDWLDPQFAVPHPQYYRQYLLHADPQGRYSVVSFVWGPGQKTPIHDHCTWGAIGMLRGAEVGQAYTPGDRMVESGESERLEPGDVAFVSPSIGDIHVVRNAYDDRVSISIHVYGTDIGKQSRHVFDADTGAAKSFISGYANVETAPT